MSLSMITMTMILKSGKDLSKVKKFRFSFTDIVVLFTKLLTGVFGQYTVPSVLAGSSWWDSDKGLIQFGQTDLTGWETEHSGGQLITGWDCSYSETNGNDLFLIFR